MRLALAERQPSATAPALWRVARRAPPPATPATPYPAPGHAADGTLTDTAVCNPNPCDAAAAIANGALNDCTSTLAHGTSCTPDCNTGYTLSGTRSCSAGTLTNTAVCNPNDCTASPDNPNKNGDDGVFYCINDGTVSGTTGSCVCSGCKAGYGGASCETAGACSASTDPSKDGTDGSIYCINTAPAASPAEQLARARARANPDTRETAATQRARAPPPRTRQRMGLMARFTVQNYTALSAEQPAIARVHAKAATGGAAVRLPARAPPPQTRLRMEPTVLSTASTAVLLVEQPGRARARAHLGIRG